MRAVYALAEYCAASPDAEGGNASTPGWAGVQDLTAFHEIVEQLQGKVFAVSYAMLGSAPEADDTAQRVFVRLYRAARPRAQQDLIRDAYRIAIDQCLCDLRLRRARRFWAWFAGSARVPARHRLVVTEGCQERNLALRYLAMLPPGERALLVLREVAVQPVDGIANIMSMKPSTVRQRLFSARQRLLRIVPAVNRQATSS
jgi:RNA polymerase sigma factor (sigma-70 family)